MEPCVSCIYLTYCMEYVWTSSLWIGIFQRATQGASRILYTGRAAVVSTITSIPFFEGNCQSETELQSMRIIIGNTSVTGRVTLFLTMWMSQLFAKLGLNSMSCGLLKIVCPEIYFHILINWGPSNAEESQFVNF